MQHLNLDDLGQYSDVVMSRSGAAVTVRFVELADADALQAYFRGLSTRSRYNRLMGAASELPAGQLDKFIHVGEADSFSVVATVSRDGSETIVGEARYAFDGATSRFELGLSVADSMQGQGIGAALLSNLECRAAALGAEHVFGDTLHSNEAMLALARKAGFTFAPTPGDWKQVRFEKQIGATPARTSCATWRLAAQSLQPTLA
jgi:RimJ/RimL family protein N-acetyltransferase